MNLKSILIVVRSRLNSSYTAQVWMLVALGFFIGLTTIPLSWNGNDISYFGVELGLYKDYSPTKALTQVLREYYSNAWVLILFYVTPTILIPTFKSFSVSQTLWLRFSMISPMELAVVRILFLVYQALFLLSLSVIWIIVVTIYHELSMTMLLVPTLVGFSAYIFMSGSFCILCGFFLRGNGLMCPIASMGIPFILFMIYLSVQSYFEYADCIPFSSPYSYAFFMDKSKLIVHYIMALLVSFMCMLIYFLSTMFVAKIYGERSL
ncbi:MAG: hypothetical protein VSS75_033080 [Candidatus Parabeggiatoa sp.]|nr:hypothetical protein [Candidatus Parabeggiatoa sp.]